MDQIKQREESTEPEKSQKLEGEVAPTAPPPPPHDPSCMNTSSVDRLSQRYASAYSSILPWIFSFDNSQSSGDTTLFPWCSAFVCPVTGKLFLPWCSDDGSPIDPKDPDCQRVRFCKKKKQADNLVATTVLSFFDRERLDPLNAKFCKYADDEAAALLAKLSGTVPQYIVEKVSIAQAVVREGNHDGDQRTEELESRLPRKRNRRREGKNRRQREESSVGESDHTKENHSTKDYSTHLEQLERRYSPEFSKSFSRWFVTWESGADRISSIFVCPKTASVFSASNCLHTDKRARCFHKGKDAENGAASVALDHFAQSGSNPLDAKVDAKEFDACSELLAGLHLPVYVSKRIAYARKLVAEGKHKGDKLTQVLGVAKSPKQLLTECYGKRLEDWFEPFPEESDWSAIFVCPLTGRVHLPDGSYGKSEEAPIRAFRSRAIAEQAAAAAALNYLERTGVVAATQKFNKEEMESVYANLRKAVRFPRSVLSLVATAQELVAEGGTFELMTEKLIRSRAATKEQATQVLIERSEMGAISSVASVQQVVSNANSQARNQAGAKPTFKTELSEIFEREGIKITPLVYFSW